MEGFIVTATYKVLDGDVRPQSKWDSQRRERLFYLHGILNE